jgi:hypothetical protein
MMLLHCDLVLSFKDVGILTPRSNCVGTKGSRVPNQGQNIALLLPDTKILASYKNGPTTCKVLM